MDRKRLAMTVKLAAASLANRRTRVAAMLLSMAIGTAVLTGLVSIYRDIGNQMGAELRAYGANLAATPIAPAATIDTRRLDKAAKALGKRVVGFSPYLYGRVRVKNADVALAGMRLGRLKKISPYIKIEGAVAGAKNKAIVGRRLAGALDLAAGQKAALTFGGRRADVEVAAIMESGGVEDNIMIVDLSTAQALLKKPGQASLAYFSVVGRGSDPAEDAKKIGGRYGFALEPIARISRNETRVLAKIKNLVFVVAGIILAITFLSVATAMMAIVIERRREVALKKALGAGDADILIEFAAEGLFIGLTGGLFGWVVGFLAADRISRAVFGAPVSMSWNTLLIAVAAALPIAAAALIAPTYSALHVQPAPVLKGE